jgi:hypothetical protein
MKTVRVYDFKAEKTNTIPAAELAPGMVHDQVHVLETVTLSALTRDQAQRAIEAMSRDESK